MPTHQQWTGGIRENIGLAWVGSHTLPLGAMSPLAENSLFLGCQEASLLRKILRWTVTQGAVHDEIRGLRHQTEVKPGPEVRGNAQLGMGVALGLWFSTWGNFTFSRGLLEVPGDIFYCGDRGREWVCYWHLVDRSQNSAKHPTIHRTAPTIKNNLVPKVSGAEVMKPWSRGTGN